MYKGKIEGMVNLICGLRIDLLNKKKDRNFRYMNEQVSNTPSTSIALMQQGIFFGKDRFVTFIIKVIKEAL